MKFDDRAKESFLKILAKQKGNKTKTCQILGINKQTFFNHYMETGIYYDPAFRQGVHDVTEGLIDDAEQRLIELATDMDNADVRALIFFLKSKGKDRGYSDRTEIAVVNPVEIVRLPSNGRG